MPPAKRQIAKPAGVCCDVDDCTDDAVQQFVTERGNGPTVSRCAAHQIPATQFASSWVVKFPK